MKLLSVGKISLGLATVGAVSYVATVPTSPGRSGVVFVTDPGNSDAASHLLAAGQQANAAAAIPACQTQSAYLPWGSAGQLRTWTPTNSDASTYTFFDAGRATGAPFQARLIVAYGDDTPQAKRAVVLELANGCRRQFQARSFAAADVSVINAEMAKHPLATDPKSYAVFFEPDRATQAQLNKGTIKVLHTQHFSLWYGVKTDAFSYTWTRDNGIAWDTFVKQAGDWAERVWQLDNALLKAPMPYATSASPKKFNIYICGTGLPFLAQDTDNCGGSASDAAWMSAIPLQAGDPTMMHEFSHSISFYTGGLRDRATAGPAWETAAQWNSDALTPNIELALPGYLSNLEVGPVWSGMRYGSWPLITAIRENDATRDLVWKIWTNNLRDSNGASQEDYWEALVRLGTASGAWPNGWRSFADFVGMFGARLVTGDFQKQKFYLDLFHHPAIAKRYVPLKASGATGNYESPAERPLYEFGTHIVPLTIASGATTVSVKLTGVPPVANSSWRFAIVEFGSDYQPVYSALGKVDGNGNATISLPVKAGKTYQLAVTATPYFYQPLGWEGDTPTITPNRFPYKVKITGATPLTGSVLVCNSYTGSDGQDLNWNTNGHNDGAIPCRF